MKRYKYTGPQSGFFTQGKVYLGVPSKRFEGFISIVADDECGIIRPPEHFEELHDLTGDSLKRLPRIPESLSILVSALIIAALLGLITFVLFKL